MPHNPPYQTAVSLLLRAAKLDPTCPQAFGILGLCYRALGDGARAIKCLGRAVGLDPLDDVSGEALSALLLSSEGQEQEQGQVGMWMLLHDVSMSLMRVPSLMTPQPAHTPTATTTPTHRAVDPSDAATRRGRLGVAVAGPVPAASWRVGGLCACGAVCHPCRPGGSPRMGDIGAVSCVCMCK